MPFVVTGLLYFTSWVAAGMLQHQARTLAAEAAGLPTYRVEMVDGLNVRLTGFTEEIERDEAVAAVDRLDSSWHVEGIMVDENESTSNPNPDPELTRPNSQRDRRLEHEAAAR